MDYDRIHKDVRYAMLVAEDAHNVLRLAEQESAHLPLGKDKDEIQAFVRGLGTDLEKEKSALKDLLKRAQKYI